MGLRTDHKRVKKIGNVVLFCNADNVIMKTEIKTCLLLLLCINISIGVEVVFSVSAPNAITVIINSAVAVTVVAVTVVAAPANTVRFSMSDKNVDRNNG